MSPRNKLILLGGLVLLMVIVAYHQLGRSRSPARNENAAPAAPPAHGTPATTSAPAGAGAEAKPVESAQNAGPSAADLRELADWFDLLRPTGSAIAKGAGPVLGLPAKGDVSAPDQSSPDSPQAQRMTEPGKLDGIIKVSNGPAKALFQDKLYQVGDRIQGTTFTIVAIDDDSVTLKNDDRVIRRFWHD